MAETSDGPPPNPAFDHQTLRLAMRSARIGTWTRDLVTEEVDWSPELEVLFGLEPGGFARSRAAFHELVHPEDIGRLRADVERAIETGTGYACEFRFRHVDGHWRWMDGRGRAEYDVSGRPVRLHGVGIDITERRLAEDRLRDEAHALEILNRVGSAVAAELDLDTLVQLVTDAATDLTGAEFGAFFYNVEDAARGRYWLYTLSGADRSAFDRFPMPRATDVFGPTFRGEGIVRSDDIREDPRYGRSEPWRGMPEGHLPVSSYLAVPVIARSGEVVGGLFFGHRDRAVFDERAERIVSGIAAQAAIAIDKARLYQDAQRELAARAAAEAALRESELRLQRIADEREQLLASERAARSEAERLSHIKDEFLATLSHELRTPLNAILGWSTLLRQPNITDADRERGLATIERNSRAQAQIINDLLDMSRIVSGKIHLEVQTIELHDVITAAVEAVAPTAQARNVRISSLLDTTIGPTRGDPNRLQQVMWNLLTNAVKFTPSGGRIEVVLERVASHVEIAVRDTGAGIRPEFLPHVFDRFRQADSSTTRHHGGLGLGLSIVRNLVELHGGTVRAESGGEGRGSSFIVALPLPVLALRMLRESGTGTAAAIDAPDASVADMPELAGARVLVVDDERDARELLMRIIEGRGGQVRGAASAAEALELLAADGADLLVSDIGMPGIDGYELMRRLREQETGRHSKPLPAIAVTAYARSDDRQRALVAGYQMHVAKPVDARELLVAIANLLRLSGAGVAAANWRA